MTFNRQSVSKHINAHLSYFMSQHVNKNIKPILSMSYLFTKENECQT